MSAIVHWSETTTSALEAMKDDEDGGGRDDRDDIGSSDGCWRRHKTAEYNILGEVGCDVSSQQPQNWMAGTPSTAGGVFLHIHKFAKPQKEGGTSGTQNVRFCGLQTCGSLAPKKKDGKFANAQFTNRNCGNLGHPNQPMPSRYGIIFEVWVHFVYSVTKCTRVLM